MKRLITLIWLMTIILASTAIAETTKVLVKRAGENLYKTETGLYIETTGCIEVVEENKAVLKYEKGSDKNEIVFENGTSCPVVIVFK